MNGYDSVLLSTTTTVVRGVGVAPEIPVTKSVRINERTRKHTWLVF